MAITKVFDPASRVTGPAVRFLRPVRGYPKALPQSAIDSAKTRYEGIYHRAFTQAGRLPWDRTEVAPFGLSDSYDGFCKIGLGLWTTELCAPGRYTQKVLMNFAGQILPDHSHRTTIIAFRPYLPTLLRNGFVDVSTTINNFAGILKYNADGSVSLRQGVPEYRYAASEYAIVQPAGKKWALPEDSRGRIVEIISGKIETFRPVGGFGILFCNKNEVQTLNLPYGEKKAWRVPAFMQKHVDAARRLTPITPKHTLFMEGGVIVRLLEDANHAFVGGDEDAVYEETSMLSLDCADRFIDKRIVR